MKNERLKFNIEHLKNIKDIFEDKSGVQLTKKKKEFNYRKLVATALAAIFCLSFGTPALASHVPAIYELMYLVSPSIAQFFMPIQRSDENDGIKMEVVSAYIHGNTAEIYITLQDLTDDRVDETTDLYDSYSINRPFDSAANCQRVGYDEGTRTATFLITINEWGHRKIEGDKITFSVKEFLSHKKNYDNISVPIDLSSVTSTEATQKVDTLGGGGLNYNSDEGESMVLVPSQAVTGFPVDGIDVTAVGYVDDKLHVQMALKNRLKNDNHGSFYLKDVDGNKVEGSNNIYFSNQYEQQEDRIDYCEYVFNIPQDEIKNYSVYGDFVTSGLLTEGYWSITFPLEQSK